MAESKKDEGLDSKSIYAGTLLSWVIALVMLFVVGGPREIVRAGKAFGWRKHVCVVERTAFDEQHGHAPALLVTVRYEVGGRPHEATRRLTGDSGQQLQHRAELFLRPGDKVDCRVDPDHPGQMMLDDEYVTFEFFLFAAVAITVVCGVASLVGAWWVRKDKAPAGAGLQFLVRKVGMMFLCGFILVFCGIATVTGFGDAIRMLRSLGWHEAKATIRTSSVTKVREGKSWGYQLDVRYVYDFGGKRYEGSKWSLFDDDTATRAMMRKALGELKEGDVVTCYVNPENPAQAVLHRQTWWFLGLPLLLAILAIAGHGFWSALREKEVARLVPPDAAPGDKTPISIATPKLPFHLQYELSRRQRLVPHMRIWMPYLPVVLMVVVGTLVLVLTVKWWLLPLLLFALWFSRGFWVGLIDVVIHPLKRMDVVVEENGLGFLAGGERWWIFLDGILRVGKIRSDTWTICHYNGQVVNIPVSAITDEQIQYIRDAAAKGKTPEGVQAIVERGRKIGQIRLEERYGRREQV